MRRGVAARVLAVAILFAPFDVLAGGSSHAGSGDEAPSLSAETILLAQPGEIVDRLMKDNVIVLQEIRDDGPLRGGIISAYVLFDPGVDVVYGLLSQSRRQIEFRPELTSVETVAVSAFGPVDEQRLKILFRRFVYRLVYRLSPARHRIDWELDERFENDLARVQGFWELYSMKDGRTLGRSGTSVDVGSAVPAFLQEWITRKNLPRTMKHVRRWVNSNGTFRP